MKQDGLQLVIVESWMMDSCRFVILLFHPFEIIFKEKLKKLSEII